MNMHKPLVLFIAALLLAGMAAAQGASTDIVIDTIKTEPVPLQTSEYADLWLRVKNNGSATADDVEVAFEPSFPFSVDPDEQTTWTHDRLLPGQSFQIHLQVRVDPNAVHGTNHLEFRTTSGAGDISITKEVPVEVRTDDAALVIRDVSFPDSVGPGTASELGFTLENLADSHLKNIDLALDIGDDQPFGTAATTRKRVQSIAPGDTATVTFELRTDESAENGVYRVPVDLDYENEAGTAFSRTESTGIVVGGASQLEVAVDDRELLAAGSRGEVTFRIVNRGQGRARFVSLELPESDDYEVLSSRSVYLGDMEPDDYQTATFDIYAESGLDTLSVPVDLAYKNADGVQSTETRDVEVTLYTSGELSRFGLAGGGSLVPLIIVAALLAGGGYWYWRRRKRRERMDVEQG